MAGVLNDLGSAVLPQVFSSLKTAGLVDTMTIKAESATSTDSGGGRVKGTASDAYTLVPVSYEPLRNTRGARFQAGDKAVSTQQYLITLPTHHGGSRINLDPKIHRFVTNTRGNEPAKTFRIISVGDVSGVVFEVICQREG